MADFQFNTDLGPKAQQGTNIADMLNLARGVQAYQQSQELNPLAVQKAKMEVEQLKQLNPLAVQKATAETKTSEFNLQKSYADKERSVLGGLANDPDFINGNKEGIVSKLKSAKSFLKAIGVPEHPEDTTDQILQIADKDSKAVLPYIKNMIQGEIGATGQQALQTPQLGSVAGAPATFVSGTGTATPLNIGGQQPAPQVATETKPQGVTSTQMSLPYPVRKAGDIRPLAPTEEKDKEAGFTYRDSLAKATQKLSTSLRNLDEVIKTAEKVGEKEWMGGAGVLGSAGRNLSVFLGTEQGVNYKRLSKDLANLQISLGADTSTDAGKQLLAAASGDITLPPDILMEIARRTRADRQNIEMQAKGAQVFSQKYGDANLKKFQEEWTNNSKDSKVFEAISIYNSDMSQEDKQKEINKLFAGASPSYLAKVKQYRNNLIKLSETGGL